MSRRIVSLIASATEMLAALGFAGEIVGISHECDFPSDAVRGRPVLTRPKMNVRRESLAIHRDVQSLVAQALAVYEIDVEKLRALQPTHIITQDQCDVCAVPYGDVERACQAVCGGTVQIVTLHPDALDDIFRDIEKVGEALGVADRAHALNADLRARMQKISTCAAADVQTIAAAHITTDATATLDTCNTTGATTNSVRAKPRVICLEWMEPLMIAGNWIPEMVALAGGDNGISKVGDHTHVVTWDNVRAFDPDVILVMPCGYTIADTFARRDELEALPGWSDTRAMRSGRVFAVDGNTYMNRPGPRIVESFAILAGLLHPKTCGHFIPTAAVAAWK